MTYGARGDSGGLHRKNWKPDDIVVARKEKSLESVFEMMVSAVFPGVVPLTMKEMAWDEISSAIADLSRQPELPQTASFT